MERKLLLLLKSLYPRKRTTVGDGLMSQIPALLISVATGMIVTRSASESNLNEDVAKQLFSQPMVLIMASIAMFMTTFIGFPKKQVIVMSVLLMALGILLQRRGSPVVQPEGAIAEGGVPAPVAEVTNEASFYCMPVVSANGNNQFSNFAFNGNPYIAREGILGSTMVGTWGIGARLKDVSFLEDLKHTLRVNFMGGTNSPKMAKYMRTGENGYEPIGKHGVYAIAGTDFYDPMYLTTEDYALEVGLTNTYKMYDNFTIMLDAAYIALWLDDSRSTWGKNPMKGYNGGDGVYDAWNVNLSFVYSF